MRTETGAWALKYHREPSWSAGMGKLIGSPSYDFDDRESLAVSGLSENWTQAECQICVDSLTIWDGWSWWFILESRGGSAAWPLSVDALFISREFAKQTRSDHKFAFAPSFKLTSTFNKRNISACECSGPHIFGGHLYAIQNQCRPPG